MCGIVGYIGKRRVVPLVLEGLRRLEYRGYDSAGLVYLHEDKLVKFRATGKLVKLEEKLDDCIGVDSYIGMGHTRWATHGAPTLDNAHPHSDCSGELVLVQNGIIENYSSLKKEMQDRGHVFSSETDTEVLVHLIEEYLQDDLATAVEKALSKVEGSYSIVVMWAKQPDRLIAVRNQCPLILGVADNGFMVASDVPAVLPYTRKVVFLADMEMVTMRADGYTIVDLRDGAELNKGVEEISWDASMAEKGGFKHFMLKEIFEQPQAILNTISGRFVPDTGEVVLEDIGLSLDELQGIEKITIVACGTSWHSALVAKYWLEQIAAIPVEVDIASEFRYRSLVLSDKTLVIAISQSGETADTLAGIRRVKELGSKVLTICNVVGSSMTRESDGVIYTHAGPEIGVASTKAFTCQLASLFLFTLYLAQVRESISQGKISALGNGLLDCVAIIEDIIPLVRDTIKNILEDYYEARDFLFVGRGLNFPIALEGALKLKEISYIHAEGYAAGELKHGPIALVDKDMPIVGLVPKDSVYQKTVSNLEEIKARQGRLLLFGTDDDQHLSSLSKDVIYLPEVIEELNPLLYTIPAQILSYEIANRRGCDVDQPRNLAKSVTVE